MSPRILYSIVVAFLIPAAPAERQTNPAQAQAVTEIRQLLKDARYGDAEKRARARVASQSEGRPAVELAVALDLLVQSLVEGGKSADPDALSSATRAVQLKESALGSSHPDLAISLANLGLVLRRLGKLGLACDVPR